MKPAKKLPKKFVGRGKMLGFKFTRIGETARAYCYQVQGITVSHFEVFLKKIDSQTNVEIYPRAKHFGVWAWIFRDEEKALEKLELL
jgi:hypothetical protein